MAFFSIATEMPSSASTTLYGPVPMMSCHSAMVLVSGESVCGGMNICHWLAASARKSPNGSLSLISSVLSSTASIVSISVNAPTRGCITPSGGFFHRLIANITSSILNGSPS